MSSRLLARFVLAISISAALSAPAFAQGVYGTGGTGGTGGTSTTGKSYGNGAAIGAVAGGVAAGALVAYMVYHKTTLLGCVEQSSDGVKMLNEKDKKTYSLDANGQDLKAGEKFQLRGKTTKDSSGNKVLHVKEAKDLGTCSATQ